MRRNITMAREMGVLDIPDTALIDIEDVDSYEPGKVCVVSTGSQGEPMSALALLARQREPLAQDHARRHRDPLLAPHPGQRDRGARR